MVCRQVLWTLWFFAVAAAALSLGVGGALAADPQANVRAEDSWWADTSGDSFPASPTRWERGYMLWYNVPSGTVPGAGASIRLPAGMDEVWCETASYFDWDGAASTSGVRAVADLSGQLVLGIDAVPTFAVETPPFSAARSISDPVLASDVEIRTVTLDLTVSASLAGYNWFNVDLLWPWSIPEGLSYRVLEPGPPPTGFSGGADGHYDASDPAALGPGLYPFTAEVEITRSGDLTEIAMGGHLYHKPASSGFYGTSTPVAPVTGTEIVVTIAPGVDATFTAAGTTEFTGGSGVVRGVQFEPIVAGMGPATPRFFEVVRSERMSLSGTALHGFGLSIQGDNIVAGTVTTPGHALYDIQFDEDEWCFDRNSATEADLAEFVAGTYEIALKGSDGVVRDFTVVLADKALPAETPVFTQPMGFETIDRRPTVCWQQPTDPNVSAAFFEIWSLGGDYDFGEFRDPTETCYTPAEDLAHGAYLLTPFFVVRDEGTTAEGVPYASNYATGTDAYFNVVSSALLTWTGTAGAAWDVGATPNWTGEGTLYHDRDRVLFDDTATTTTIDVAPGGVEPWSVTFDNSTVVFVLEGGAIRGTTGLTKRGSGLLRIRSANAFGGPTRVEGGTLQLENLAALGGPGSPSPMTLGEGTVLNLRHNGDNTGAGEVLAFGNDVTLEGDARIDVRRLSGSTAGNKRLELGALEIGDATLTVGGAHGYALRFSGLTSVTGDATLDVDSADLQLLGGLAVLEARTLIKEGAALLTIDGPQQYAAGSVLEILDGAVWLGSDAGSETAANLSISVTDAAVYFGCDQHLDTLTIGDGGRAVFAGAGVVVLQHLVLDGVDLGAVALTPEPATLALVALGGVAALLRRRRR